MERISDNRDLFSADADERIRVRVEARKLPFEVTFSDLFSGHEWTVLQEATEEQPVEIRQFSMPADAKELFTIVYGFPTEEQTDPAANYRISFSGKAATADGPTSVLPPASGDLEDLPYEFRLLDAPMAHFMTPELAAKVQGN